MKTQARPVQALALPATALVLGALCFVSWIPLRVVAGIPLTLVLPGYAVTAAIAGRAELRIEMRVGLTLGLSITTLILGSVLLNATPGGLQRLPWAIYLVVVISAAGAIATARSSRLLAFRLPARPALVRAPSYRPPSGRGTGTRRSADRGPTVQRASDARHPSAAAWVILILAAGLCCAALVGSRVLLSAPNAIGYTALSISLSGQPDGRTVVVGVRSGEKRTVAYMLVVTVNGRRIADRTFGLRPSQRRRFSVTAPRGSLTQKTGIVANLFHAGSSKPYRTVNLVLDAGRPAAGSNP